MGVHGGRKNRDSGERKAALRNEGEEKTIGTTKEDRKIAEKGKASSSRQKWRKPATGPRRRTRGARRGRGSAPGARGGGMERQQVAAEEVPVKRRPAAAQGPRTAPRGDGGGAGGVGGHRGLGLGSLGQRPPGGCASRACEAIGSTPPKHPIHPKGDERTTPVPPPARLLGHRTSSLGGLQPRSGPGRPRPRCGRALLGAGLGAAARGARWGSPWGPRPPHLHPGRSTCPWTAAGRS